MVVNKIVSSTFDFGSGTTWDGAANSKTETIFAPLRQLFIDAGLMAEWHDSWSVSSSWWGTASYYFRVLKVTLDANKTYGTYYITFGAGYYPWAIGFGLYVSCGGWNATSHTPTGTQYVDYFVPPNGNNAQDYWYQYWTAGSTITAQFVGYKSGDTLVFFIRGMTAPLVIKTSLDNQPSWVDMNKVCVPTIFRLGSASGGYANQWRGMYFASPYQFRRSVYPGRSVTGTSSSYFRDGLITAMYQYNGCSGVQINSDNDVNVNDPQSTGNYFNWGGALRLPWSMGSPFAPQTSTPWAPMITNIDMWLPLNMKLPSDFSLVTLPSTSKSLGQFERVKVSDSEVWEVIWPMASTPGFPNTMALMGRVV